MITAFVPMGGGPVTENTLIRYIKDLNLTTSLTYVVDASDRDSFRNASDQTLYDTSGNGNDFWLGGNGSAGSADPPFFGSVGGQSINEYFDITHPDEFTLKTAFPGLSTINSAGASWTWAGWRYTRNDGTNTIIFFRPQHGSGPANMWFGQRGAPWEVLQLWTTYNDGSTNSTFSDTLGLTNTPGWHFIACSCNDATKQVIFQLDGSQSVRTKYTNFYAATTDTLRLRSNSLLENRLGCEALWLRALSSGELTSLFNASKGRYGL